MGRKVEMITGNKFTGDAAPFYSDIKGMVYSLVLWVNSVGKEDGTSVLFWVRPQCDEAPPVMVHFSHN